MEKSSDAENQRDTKPAKTKKAKPTKGKSNSPAPKIHQVVNKNLKVYLRKLKSLISWIDKNKLFKQLDNYF